MQAAPQPVPMQAAPQPMQAAAPQPRALPQPLPAQAVRALRAINAAAANNAPAQQQFEICPSKIVRCQTDIINQDDINMFNGQNDQERQDAFWAIVTEGGFWLNDRVDAATAGRKLATDRARSRFAMYWAWMIALLNWKINEQSREIRKGAQYLSLEGVDYSKGVCSYIISLGRDAYEMYLSEPDFELINNIMMVPGETFIDVYGRLRAYNCDIEFAA